MGDRMTRKFGIVCPYCNSTDTGLLAWSEDEVGYRWETWGCNNCGSEWDEE